MSLFSLTAISPIDGRYNKQVNSIKKIFSEYALIKFRLEIEIKWLKKLSSINKIKEIHSFNKEEINFIDKILITFNKKDAIYIKNIEKKINHDVKAVEYFLKEKLLTHPKLKLIAEFIHFACTSEDINNLSYAMILKMTKYSLIIPYWNKIIFFINKLSLKYKNIPLLSRTHGQPATPSTMGKELAIFVFRMQRQLIQLEKIKILGKINGTVGNYNAHYAAYPKINWHKISNEFVNSLGITWNPYTTQIESHDYIAELLNCVTRFNDILIDFTRDIWGYISLNYFKQKIQSDNEVGSSIMPHKINPINFENAEGNLGLSNAIFHYISSKLLVSRWQRDLTDSTILRNIGVSFSYSLIAYKSSITGISKLELNISNLKKDLAKNWAVIAEPIQTLMRRYGIKNSYEKLKKITRGKKINEKKIKSFIKNLNIPFKEKERLISISPFNYIGYAKKLVEEINNFISKKN